MTPWNEADPPVLPPAPPGRRLLAVLRLAAIALGTPLLLAAFLIAQALNRAGLPRWQDGVQSLWARMCLSLCGLSLRVEGTRMPHGGALVANHVSWIDIFTILAAGRVTFLAKAEVRGWPGIGPLAAVTGTMFIERRAAAARRQQEEMRARIARGELLCFFPEGTSTDGMRVLPFKSTLFAAFMSEELRAAVWVQPVTLVYDPPVGLPAAIYGWWGEMPFGRHVWDVTTRSRGGRATVIYHPPLRAADFADRKALAAACGRLVAEGMAAHRARHPLPEAV
ncbi:MAG: hypothetical protein KatS3mg118_0129 [Paracoccaceae bacterium]|nr:MAG: hypothetical protein KatS3mg118_0129 [Paracoccaceae bacterium]